MRDLRKVLDSIIAVIPPQEDNFKQEVIELRKELNLLPPELMQHKWLALSSIVKSYYINDEGMIKEGLGVFVPRIISFYTEQDIDEVIKTLYH